MADNEKKGTIYQQLNQFLNIGGFDTPDRQSSISASTPAKETKVIIKGNSPEEIHKKGLELQQKRELQNKFFRTTDRGFQKSLQYEAARLPAYIDYEGMEYYPIISSALDLFMEETTTIGINGKMLNIYSNKERIKYLLEEFFYDIVNVNVNLPFWTRNLPVKYDSMIPLLDGETITIKEISERLKENPSKEIWTCAIQDETKKILPAKIIWCDLTRKNSEILKIYFDNDKFVETTPDHEFMLRNGSYKRADELKSGDSLMPYYTTISKESDCIKGYEKVYNPSTNHYGYTHRIVAQECIQDLEKEKEIGEKFITHHIDFNKLNNSPSNLKRMTTSDHFQYHAKLAIKYLKRPDVVEKRMKGIDKYLRSQKRRDRMSNEMMGIYPTYFNEYNNSSLHEDHNITRKNRMNELWSSDEYQEKVKNKMTLKIDDDCLNIVINHIKNDNEYITSYNLSQILRNDNIFMKKFIEINNHFNKKKNLYKSINNTTLKFLIKRKTGKSYCEFNLNINPNIINESNFKRTYAASKSKISKKESEVIINHKILRIEKSITNHDVYCMEVVGQNNEQDRHNFPICGKDENGDYQRDGVFVSNCKYGDNFTLLYGERKKGITHVKQLVNYEIERFERINEGKPIVKFKERMTGDEFNSFEIAHFRLLGDDKYLPYGSSVLNKIRRVFRQLILAEDAMLTYRIVRAGEKKVFKIDVGNIDEDDIEEYIYKVATKFKKTAQVSPNDGQIDYRFNILGNDEDYFIPVRNANTQSGIDTLPGASNLSDIQDIEYLRDNLFIGIGIPKPFLSFQDAAGGGKNLAQYDIRFSKKINRIQQALIQELNKMAMIHLYLLGYDIGDVGDFVLTLTNPSTQQELLKSELMRDKAQTYNELTRGEGGIAAMSHTGAKRLLFYMSDKEIIDDLKQQKMEKVVMQELADSPVVIKKSGLFTDIDSRFGEPVEGMPVSGATEQGGGMPPIGGGSELPPIGGGMPPMGGGGELPPVGGGGMPPAGGGGELPPMMEKRNKINKSVLTEEEYEDHIEKLVYGSSDKEVKKNKTKNRKILKENNDINEGLNKNATNSINEINILLENGNSFNKEQKNIEDDDIDIEKIDIN